MFLSTGTVTTLAGSPGGTGSADGTGAEARFYHPWRIVGDGEGGLFVSDQFNSTIRRVVMREYYARKALNASLLCPLLTLPFVQLLERGQSAADGGE
jgi:hypothetical protein